MTWFLVALISPLLYSFTNHIDKHLLSKYFKDGGVGTLILISSLFAVFALPISYFIDPTVLGVNPKMIVILAFVGALDIAVIWFYLLALKNEEASVTIVFYQLVPVLGLVFGYFLLGESITTMQFFAMMIIIFGTSIIAFEIDTDNNFTVRWMTAIYMTAACACWAGQSVILKYVALEEDVWRSLFWKYLVMTIIGLIILVTIHSYRKHFFTALRTNSAAILSLNFGNEFIYLTGAIIAAFAAMMAPVALVLLGNSFQPIFVLAIGIVLTLFFPHLGRERIEARNLWQKLFAIIVTGIGTYILLTT